MIGYEFPRKALQDEDMLDPSDVSSDYIVAAEKLSGNLNEHALTSNALANVAVADSAFASLDVAYVEANPAFGSVGAFTPPTFSDANDGWVIPNHGNWERVDGLNLTMSTTGCTLWIVSCLQPVWELVQSNDDDEATYQVAHRLDGAVLDWTISGQANPMHQTYYAYKYPTQKSGDVAIPGPATPKHGIVASIGEPCLPDRCISVSMFQLTAGSHDIEVVARRGFRANSAFTFSTNDNVWIFDRMLFALAIPSVVVGVSSAYEFEVTPFETNQTLVTAELYDPLSSMRTQYNDSEASNWGRGAFNHNHGYGAALFTAQEYIAPGSFQTTTSGYPGYSSTTIDATGSGTGWYLLNDGAGKNLRTDETTPAGFALADTACCILVLANIQVKDIDSIDDEDFAAFTILYRVNGTVAKIPASTFFLNSSWRQTGTVLSAQPCGYQVAIAGVLDLRDTPLTHDLEWIGVYASMISTNGSALRDLDYQNASMQVIVFRP